MPLLPKSCFEACFHDIVLAAEIERHGARHFAHAAEMHACWIRCLLAARMACPPAARSFSQNDGREYQPVDRDVPTVATGVRAPRRRLQGCGAAVRLLWAAFDEEMGCIISEHDRASPTMTFSSRSTRTSAK